MIRRSGVTPTERLIPRHTPLAGTTEVDRYLPSRRRTTVGAWCFLDHFGPDDLTGEDGMRVGPHPHTGLQAVTWLVAGDVVHRDSLGHRQPIRPGQLNLMTAGRGVVHAEDSPVRPPRWLHGLQLWVALPEAAREIEPAFEHHPTLPVARLDSVRATVLVGELAGSRSPATTYSSLVAADLTLLRPPGGVAPRAASVPVERGHEHALLVMAGDVTLDGVHLPTGACVYLPRGRAGLALAAGTGRAADGGPPRVLLFGGEPFTEPLVMWWNFVGRSHDEVAAAREDWEAGRRFGEVEGSPTGRVPAPELGPGRLRPRLPAS